MPSVSASLGQGHFDYRDGVAVLQVVVFGLFLMASFFLCLRHGFSRNQGWIILVLLSLIRILSGSFWLATIHTVSRTTLGGALICQAIGLAPLVVMNIALLNRFNTFLRHPLSNFIFYGINGLTAVGVVLAIYGGIRVTQSNDPYSPSTIVDAALIVFVVIYAIAIGMWFVLFTKKRDAPRREQILLWCFLLCIPFIACRLVYSLLVDFANDPARFNTFEGDETIFLCMAVLTEMVAVAICIATGFRLPKLVNGREVGSSTDSNIEYAAPRKSRW